MKAKTIINVLCASHYTYLVTSEWRERGGILFVSPPGHLKTTWLNVLAEYPATYFTTDLNLQSLGGIKDDIIGGLIRTLVIPDVQKIYERHPAVASNVEGAIRAMVEEGFVATAYQDASAIMKRARVLFLSACTTDFYLKRLPAWRQSGFMRRLIFSSYTLKRPDLLMRALVKWKKEEIHNGFRFSVPANSIPYSLTQKEALKIQDWMREQKNVTPTALIQKIGCVLRWRFRHLKVKDETMDILEDFSESLSGEGAEVEL